MWPCCDREFVVERLQDRHDRVGRARRRADDPIVFRQRARVDARNDVADGPFAWRCDDDARRALRLQVLRQAFFVAPRAGVVDDDGVFDAVLRVIDARGRVRVDDADDVAVRDDAVVLFVDTQRSLERTVHRVAPQQARALDEILLTCLAYDDRAQEQLLAAAGLFDQQTRQQSADASEPVQHHVLRSLERRYVTADDLSTGRLHEVHRRRAVRSRSRPCIRARAYPRRCGTARDRVPTMPS